MIGRTGRSFAIVKFVLDASTGVVLLGIASSLAVYNAESGWNGWPWVAVLALGAMFSLGWGLYMLRSRLKLLRQQHHETPPMPGTSRR